MSGPRDRHLRLAAAAIVVLAAGFTAVGVPLASAQGTTIFVRDADGTIPADDPWATGWDRINPTSVLLSGQAAVPPSLLAPTVASVRVRALADDSRIAVMVEWTDPTRDDSALHSDHFADGVALQFAQGEGISICMGQQAGAINVWHWKADWAADLAGREDVEEANPNIPLDEIVPARLPPGESPAPGPAGFLTARDAGNIRAAAERRSSVEDLNAVGFGSLTPQPADRQNVHGASDHRNGVWRVVLSRALATNDLSDAVLGRGARGVVAFAVWDGSNGDRNGRKAVSSWLALAYETRPVGFLDEWPLLLVLFLALVLSGYVLYLGAKQPAVGLGWPASVLEPPAAAQETSGTGAGSPSAPGPPGPGTGGA